MSDLFCSYYLQHNWTTPILLQVLLDNKMRHSEGASRLLVYSAIEIVDYAGGKVLYPGPIITCQDIGSGHFTIAV